MLLTTFITARHISFCWSIMLTEGRSWFFTREYSEKVRSWFWPCKMLKINSKTENTIQSSSSFSGSPEPLSQMHWHVTQASSGKCEKALSKGMKKYSKLMFKIKPIYLASRPIVDVTKLSLYAVFWWLFSAKLDIMQWFLLRKAWITINIIFLGLNVGFNSQNDQPFY